MKTGFIIISISIELFLNVRTFRFVFIVLNRTNQLQKIVANANTITLFQGEMPNSKYGGSQEIITTLGTEIPRS